jgi:energy-coupling factor transporter ATP-binding protein EcfA2
MPIRFKRIHIKHLLGIDEAEYEPGTLTLFEGPNASGKTSHVRALTSLLGGKAKQPTIMNGFESGEITVELDNGYTLEKIFTAGKQPTLIVKDERGRHISAPQEFVNRLIRAISMNPIRFAADDTPAKERLEMLLTVAPLELTIDEVTAIIGDTYDLGKWFGLERTIANGLPVIDAIRKRIYETDRRDINRDLDQKLKHAVELRVTLPDDMPADSSARLQGAKNDYFTAQSARQELIRRSHEQRDKELMVLREQEADELARIQQQYSARRQELRDRSEKALAEATASQARRAEELAAEIAQLETQLGAYRKVEQTLASLGRYKLEVAALQEKAQAFSTMLAGLDELRRSKLEHLPVPVQINGDEILVEIEGRGLVPIEDTNTAKRLGLGLELAVAAAGECGVICIDGLERLDLQNQRAFIAQAVDYGEERGLQFFATCVTSSGDLHITTINPDDSEPASLFAEQPEKFGDANDVRKRRARKT